MCNYPLVRPISRENDTISSRTASSINILITQDGKFVIRSSIWKGEIFVVVILVRVFIAAYSGPILVITVALLYGGVNVILGITCTATGLCTLALGAVRLRLLIRTKRDEHEGEGWRGRGGRRPVQRMPMFYYRLDK